MAEEEAKRIARQWTREIEEEIRMRDEPKDKGPGRILVWTVLWLAWLVVLGVIVGWAALSR
jgi:hypothetical protein